MIAGLLVAPSAAEAQDEPPFDPAVDVQLFDYAIGQRSFLTVADSDTMGKKQFSLDFLVTFFTNPFVIYNFNNDDGEITEERTTVVKSVVSGQLTGAYGLTDKLQLGVSLPIVFAMSGNDVDPFDAMETEGFSATGLGDALLELKLKAWENDQIAVSASGGMTVPTSVGSHDADFLGDNLPTGRLRGGVQWRAPNHKFSVGANMGVILRKPRTIYETEIGQQLTYGVAGMLQAAEKIQVIAEVFGRGALPGLDLDTSPLEAAGGARVQVAKTISVLAGGGAGLTEGLGSPELRLFAAVGYAPDFRDTDGDGLANQNDACPLLAEDKDDYEDSDGCPDEDNDSDRRLDGEDKCPLKAEDLDGYEDDDGCPELDNDKDGIKDFDDRCPTDAEDKKAPYDKDGCPANKRDSDDDGKGDDVDQCVDDPEDDDGFEDWDGCPETDNDKDGVLDPDDKCKLCMEDKDSFEDEDGCPELDNDRDGVADTSDKCANEAETINGVKDGDGCPDTGGKQVADLDGNIIRLSAPIDFDKRDAVKSTGTVDQIAAVMTMHPEVVKWRVVVAAKKQKTDEVTRQKSQKQADAIRIQLASRGISNDRIEAVGAVSDNPTIAIAVLERAATDGADDGGMAMCPENLRAHERGAPATPVAAMPAAGSGDKDGDGLTDATDQCPNESGPSENRGCPDTDIDEDGVIDRLDNCPDEKGTEKNYGCKEKQLVVITETQLKILDVVYFDTGKATIQKRSNKLLDNVAAVLSKHPEIKKIRVEGHTDDRGDDAFNKDLSQRRADSVRDYIIGKGLPADRIDSYGFGEEKPIAPNSTKKGQAANRRVEFNIVNE
ncbi:MAG TPA: OmpA family protein [Kofleriaceae bacterium]|nr:OmpA family protein [Kofleriaceae bacterium]